MLTKSNDFGILLIIALVTFVNCAALSAANRPRRYEIHSPKEFFDRHDVLTTATDDDAFFEAGVATPALQQHPPAAVPTSSSAVLGQQRLQRRQLPTPGNNNKATTKPQPVAKAAPVYPLTAAGEIDYGPNVSKVITHIITNKGYDKRIRPNYKGRPVNVGLTLFISGVSSVSEVNMDVTLDFYFRQFWQDPRLGFDGMWDEELVIGGEFMREIWRPDTFFVNAKQAFFHQITMLNTFLRITPIGNVTQSLRLTVTASCPMDFTYFPMDSQRCSLEIESFGYTTRDITYRWAKFPIASVAFAPEVQLPQFRVRGHREVTRHIELSTAVEVYFARSIGYYLIQVYLPSSLIVFLSFVSFWVPRDSAPARVALGNYSRLAVEIYFERSLGYYLIQVYVPSSLIVMLSLVSFWINRESAPARVSLGITTVLTMTTLISSTNASLPKISYLKAIDVYLVSCFIMVFAALLEYAAVTYTGKRCKMLQSKTNKLNPANAAGSGVGQQGAMTSKSNPNTPRYRPHVNGGRSRNISESQQQHTSATTPLMGSGGVDKNNQLTNRKPSSGNGNGGGEEANRPSNLVVSVPPDQPQSGVTPRVVPPLYGLDSSNKENQPLSPSSTTATQQRPQQQANDGSDTEGSSGPNTSNCCDYCRCVDAKASDIEKYSRIVFPTVFACFNILYWITYLNISVVTDEEGFIAAEET